MHEKFLHTPIGALLDKYPYIEEFLIPCGIKNPDLNLTPEQIICSIRDYHIEGLGMDREQLRAHYIAFVEKMEALKKQNTFQIRSVTVLGGRDKSGAEEGLSFTMKPGDILCLVGPTGSGKSRLLADIECLAQGDTPSGRQILINDQAPDPQHRFSMEHKLVAQLSQNMNFVMDLTVAEFLNMHAESRMISNAAEVVEAITACANDLAGEKFDSDVPVTQLSGGQSRALMIADAALLSLSPIILIDEIENAGVDRRKALELLVKKEKIVLMATHDPILALMGDRRLVIKNGGLSRIIETQKEEKDNLSVLQQFDAKILALRNMLRSGGIVDFDVRQYLMKQEEGEHA